MSRKESGHIDYADFVEIMTQKMAERDPEEEIRKAFQLFDDDQSGAITVKNLRRVARELVCDIWLWFWLWKEVR